MYCFSSGVSSRRWTVARKAAVLLAVSCAVLLFSVPLFSQGNLGRITGSVTDASGGAIVGATVTDTDVARGVSRSVTTDSAGQYAFPGLNPGTHKIHVEAKGFKTTEHANVPLIVGGDVKVDLTMQPGEVTETVVVTETIPTIDTTSATLGGTLQNEVINDLPLNGRNFENLLQMRPGVTIYAGGGGWTQSTNGVRPHDNMYMVDGIDSNDPWMGQSVMNAAMAAGDAGTILPIDSIQEFHTEQNPKAEFGWKPGSVVNVGIKSGTNAIHGTAYAYGRDGAWDAQDWNPGSTVGNPPVQVEQFGASVGGPIKKDKLFYFANYEQQRYSVGNPATSVVPVTSGAGATDPKWGLIGACKAVGANLTPLSAQMAGLNMACQPLSNFPGLFPANAGAPGDPIVANIASVNEINSGVGKIDWHPREKDSISGMYYISPGSGSFIDTPGLQVATPWLTNQSARSQVGSGTWVHTFSSSLLNEFRGGLSHYTQSFVSNDSSINPANYQYNGSTYHMYTGVTNPARFGLPRIIFPQKGFSFQMGHQWPKFVGPDSVINLSDQMSWLHGTHALKFGVEFLDNLSTNDVSQDVKGRIRFQTMQAFFAGTPNQVRFASGNLLRHLSSQAYAAFLQDDWRIKPRLTLNLGVRYELSTVVKEANNLIGNFDPNVGPVQVGKQISSPYNGDHNNFAPRVGFAWDVAGNGKTVVRGGAGITYEQATYDSMMALGNLLGLRTEPTGVPIYLNGNAVSTNAGGNINVGDVTYDGGGRKKFAAGWAANGPNNPLFNATPACGDGTVTVNGNSVGPCTIFGVDRNIRTPYVTSWNLGIQRAITNDLTLDVSYVGNHATKLWNTSDLNQPRLQGGFAPGWGNPALAGTPANDCLLSAPTGYDNCAADPNGDLEPAAQPYATKFPYLANIMWLSNAAESNYHSLQVVATQRTAHGLSFTAGYTYAHALDTASDNWTFETPTNSANPRGNYGNSQFDIRQNFTLTTTYAIPGIKAPGQILQGWSINSVLSYNTGMPWGVNDYSTDFSGTGEINQPGNPHGEQWNFYGNPADFKTTKAMFYNTTGGQTGGISFYPGTSNAACLAKETTPLGVAALTDLGCYAVGSSILLPPAYGSYGTTTRNMFPGPGFFNWDFSVTKEFKIKERLTTQFRAEAFNILNHVNITNPFGGPGGDNTYTDPSGDIGGAFGIRQGLPTPDVSSSNPVLGSGGARAIQLGLKIIF